jgi:dihydroxy-acid dehydratase
MVRISDARMSGTAYGTIVLSVATKRIDLLVDENEVKRHLATWSPPPAPARGYSALYRRTVLQVPQGCDFDFLVGASDK